MQPLINFGVSFIIALQSLGAWLVLPMKFFSFLGTEQFFLLLLPLLYWSVDSALGIRVGLILATGNLLNYAIKLTLAAPRPYWVSSHVRGLWLESSFGAPSGHAQTAMGVWGIVGAYVQKTWVRVLAGALIFFIGFSRLVLGSHFPHDVLLGWLLGGVTLWLFLKFWQPVAAWLNKKTFWAQIQIAFIASLLFILIGYGAFWLRSDFQIPQTWLDTAALSAGEPSPAPLNADSPFTSAGVFFGFAAGLAWNESRGGYRASGSVPQRALRYALGMLGLLILYAGLGALFPRGETVFAYALRYARYALIGFWAAGGAPWVFQRFHLI
ncbi:MAG: hypothetical protein Fur002_05820 [Anaerolineales bacterium]